MFRLCLSTFFHSYLLKILIGQSLAKTKFSEEFLYSSYGAYSLVCSFLTFFSSYYILCPSVHVLVIIFLHEGNLCKLLVI